MTETNQKLWFYFTVTVAVSFLPSIVRLCLSLGTNVSIYDAKDTLFAALALLISNFTLIGDNTAVKKRRIILYGSAGLGVPILIFTVVLMLNENTIKYDPPLQLKVATHLFSFVSVAVSFGANNSVYNVV